MDDGEVLWFWVRNVRGDGVLVTVYNAEDGDLVTGNAAGTWVDVAALGLRHGVPKERWLVDDVAREVLDADRR